VNFSLGPAQLSAAKSSGETLVENSRNFLDLIFLLVRNLSMPAERAPVAAEIATLRTHAKRDRI